PERQPHGHVDLPRLVESVGPGRATPADRDRSVPETKRADRRLRCAAEAIAATGGAPLRRREVHRDLLAGAARDAGGAVGTPRGAGERRVAGGAGHGCYDLRAPRREAEAAPVGAVVGRRVVHVEESRRYADERRGAGKVERVAGIVSGIELVAVEV